MAAAAMLGTAGAAESGHDGADPDNRIYLKCVGCVLGRLAGALASAAGVFGTVGSSGRGASGNLAGMAEIVDGGVDVRAGLGLACRTLERSGRVLVRVGDGRPVSIGKGNNLMCRSIGSNHCSKNPIYRMQRPVIELDELPEDVMEMVFSKLQFNEMVRTSVLSSKWRHMWTVSSKLSLDCMTICGRRRYFCNKQKFTQKFIDGVNTVLRQLCGKNLALDLAPAQFIGFKDRYSFPIELFDSASLSRIQHIQLSCISLKPCSPFRGFPNLKKLDLHLFDVCGMDLDEMLSGCANLEWLSLIRCCVDDDVLKVKQPLPHLLYLRVAHCRITKVELRADNLKTFVYHGRQLPIYLGQVNQLETAELRIYCSTLEYVLTVLPDVLLGVQNITLRAYLPLQMPSLLENIGNFSQLRFLQLLLFISCSETDNILSLVSFLRAAPMIEELVMHFDATCLEGVAWGTLRSLPPCKYNYLRRVHITGFNGIKGQLEFLVHIVENAPVLKVLTIDPRKKLGLCNCKDSDFWASRASVRRELERKLLLGTVVNIL
ncbi:unnamed protein product [Urochloa decumbens]|uniref:F-box domain-containing protein n=1 Tax=Urochloa decumbens TaxID=240449 RepID=A0ABC9DYU4_9POAL